MMDDCIFCKIVKGEIPSNKIYEDEKVIAILDIQPVNPGHVLVIPKKHSTNVFDIEESEMFAIHSAIKKLSIPLLKAVNGVGLNILQNNGKPAGQLVLHTHVHMIPRFEGDGHKQWSHSKYKSGEAENIAKEMRKLLK